MNNTELRIEKGDVFTVTIPADTDTEQSSADVWILHSESQDERLVSLGAEDIYTLGPYLDVANFRIEVIGTVAIAQVGQGSTPFKLADILAADAGLVDPLAASIITALTVPEINADLVTALTPSVVTALTTPEADTDLVDALVTPVAAAVTTALTVPEINADLVTALTAPVTTAVEAELQTTLIADATNITDVITQLNALMLAMRTSGLMAGT